MKLSFDFDNHKYERRKSSKLSTNLFLQKNITPISNSPNISKKTSSFSLNKINSKESFKVNKTPIGQQGMKPLNLNPLKSGPLKLNSINMNSIKKKKLFKTGKFNDEKLSIRNMEINIRKKLIDLSAKIEYDDQSFDNVNIDSLMNKNVNKNFNQMTKSLNINAINKKQINKFPSYSKLTNSLSKSNKNSPKNNLVKLSNKSVSIYSRIQINESNYRKIVRTKILYDSFEDNESENEKETIGLFLSPKENFIFVFDLLIIISTLFIEIYNPYYISTMKCYCYSIHFLIRYCYYITDFLYICDLLLGFGRAYYNIKFQLVTQMNDIIKHYISTNFLLDLLQSFPTFTLISFQCSKNENNICLNYNMKTRQMLLIIFTAVKQLKFFKIINKKTNSVLFKLYELTNEKIFSEKMIDIPILFFSVFFGFFIFISLNIFIASQNYPNWITIANLQDRSIFIKYLNSFYFIMTTITTVGYGDMLGHSLSENVFKIVLLPVGISLYSWIVSYIGNHVNNESRISIRFNKDEGILEEIRIAYPNLPFKLYNQILHHLELRKLRQKKLDLNLLINSLPYSLRNTILFTIHQQVIRNFKIFKRCQNSDFINQLLTNFIPLFSKKNAILIYENQLIENIIFIKEGRLSIEAAIDIHTPEKSINDYFYSKFIDINDKTSESKMNSLAHLTSKSVIPTELDINPKNNLPTNIHSEMDESTLEKEIGKCEFEGGEFEESNYHFINIVCITKNESYGIVYMFLSKPSPLSLRVKSKKAELFLLRKFDAFSISKRFPNIWKRQYNKSYINMNSIKNKTFKKLTTYCETYGVVLEKKEPNLKHNNYTIKEILEKAKKKTQLIFQNQIFQYQIFLIIVILIRIDKEQIYQVFLLEID